MSPCCVVVVVVMCLCRATDTRMFYNFEAKLREAARLLKKEKLREKKKTRGGVRTKGEGRARDLFCALMEGREQGHSSLCVFGSLRIKKESATRQKKTKHTKAYQHIQK